VFVALFLCSRGVMHSAANQTACLYRPPDMNLAKDTDPPLTPIRIDGTRIGKPAASLLVERIRDGEVDRRMVDVGFRQIERESC